MTAFFGAGTTGGIDLTQSRAATMHLSDAQCPRLTPDAKHWPAKAPDDTGSAADMRPFLLPEGDSQASRIRVAYGIARFHLSSREIIMNKFLLAAVFVVAGAVSVSAADLPARSYTKAPAMAADPAYDWSGFYIGGHVGYLWGKTRVVDDGVLTESGAPTNGVVGGVLAGYNWQSGPLVLGIEGDIGWTNAVGHGQVAIITTTTPNTYDLRWTSHVVGKAGYAVGHWLFFATGGLSIADLDFIEGVTTTTIPQRGGIYTGFSAGGGVEYAFTRNLLGRLQYIYDDFGGKTYVAADGGIYRVSLTSQTLRGVLSWKF